MFPRTKSPSTAGPSAAGLSAAAGGVTLAATTVPQAWQPPHRPAHFVLRQPHSEHSCSTVGDDFPMAAKLPPATDSLAGQLARTA